MVDLGDLLRLCCWSTSMDNSLRYALALRNRNNIAFRSCLCLCLCFCFHWILCPCHGTRLPLEPFLPPFFPPSSLVPLVHSSGPFPRCHVPDPFGPFLSAPLLAWYPFPSDRTHVVVWHVVARVLITLCRLRVVRTNVSQVHWYWSVVGQHFVDDDLQFFHTSIEFPRSRPRRSGETQVCPRRFTTFKAIWSAEMWQFCCNGWSWPI